METTINAAKERIKARGDFPTTPRLVAEAGYTVDGIDAYFEERLVTRRGEIRRPLLSMIGYLSNQISPLSEGRPLPAMPDYAKPKGGG